MSLEESNKMSRETPSQDSLSNPRPEEEIAAQLSGNDYSPDVTDMLWTTAKKQAAQERLHDDIRRKNGESTTN